MNDKTKESEAGFFSNADLICVYTRSEALEDGFLVDVSGVAKEAGFRYPVALTFAYGRTSTPFPKASPGRTRAGGCGTF